MGSAPADAPTQDAGRSMPRPSWQGAGPVRGPRKPAQAPGSLSVLCVMATPVMRSPRFGPGQAQQPPARVLPPLLCHQPKWPPLGSSQLWLWGRPCPVGLAADCSRVGRPQATSSSPVSPAFCGLLRSLAPGSSHHLSVPLRFPESPSHPSARRAGPCVCRGRGGGAHSWVVSEKLLAKK